MKWKSSGIGALRIACERETIARVDVAAPGMGDRADMGCSMLRPYGEASGERLLLQKKPRPASEGGRGCCTSCVGRQAWRESLTMGRGGQRLRI